MHPLITPVMIVRDEERFLPEALRSLSEMGPVLARACVYDTGSVDSTVDLAAGAGAIVRLGYWDDDFARAKNEAAAMARSAWVLSIDADERVVGDPGRLIAALRAAQTKGLDSLVIDVDDDRSGEIVNTAPSVRLFRPGLAHFRNRIHEVVVRRDGRTRQAARLPRDVLRLRHVGYGPAAAMGRRQERNSRIGDLEVAAAREQGEDQIRLVEALVNRGRSRSIGGEWEAGIPDWVEARTLTADTPFHLYAGELLARAYVETGQVSDAVSVLQELRGQGSDAHLLAWLTARAFALTGRPQQTVQALRDIAPPVSALGERHSIAPVLQTRMVAAVESGETEVAIDDAIQLMAGHGVHGFGRLLLLLWAGRSPAELARRLESVGVEHLDRILVELEALGDQGRPLADAIRAGANGVHA